MPALRSFFFRYLFTPAALRSIVQRTFFNLWQIIACICDVYREHGMRVNPQKSGVVLGVRGLQATELLKKHLQGTGDKLCLVIGIGQGELRIPVKTSMQYLGICVSYDNFEQETLTARLKVAQATRSRLSKVLSARRYLTQQQRIHLYVLCIRSAALYGLGAVGMTSKCLRKLQIFEVQAYPGYRAIPCAPHSRDHSPSVQTTPASPSCTAIA